MGRAPCCAKIGLNRGAWTAKEDKILLDYIETHGEGNWRNLPKNAGLKRCGKSCRLRWMNYLRPDIKRGNISEEEEDLIVRLHKLLGNRWSLIAGRLPGRTDNEIKNYWNTHLSKKLQMKNQSRPRICRTRKPKSSPERVQKEESTPEGPESLHPSPVRTMPIKPQSQKNVSQAPFQQDMDVSMSWQELLNSSFPSLEKENGGLNQPNRADVMDVENLLDLNECEDLSSPSESSPAFQARMNQSLAVSGTAQSLMGDDDMVWIHDLDDKSGGQSFNKLLLMDVWEEVGVSTPPR
eukprot:TRINITY_DN3696_c0_g2_i3.p1 TRINITY_DN3696_c0_g2~~TRINITY_DN3696_c0_g2_i3.p1  ORF type:complete len:294 (+),score=59.49 TRINITY_DN3696_c0_g2_i3:487-1368(+)